MNAKSTKSAATAKAKKPAAKSGLIINHKDAKSTDYIDPAHSVTIKASEVAAASGLNKTVFDGLCYNIMAGKVDKAIMSAASLRTESGKASAVELKKLFPAMGKNEMTALQFLSGFTAAQIVSGWNKYAAGLKRVHGVSLQAMAKAMKPAKSTEARASLKEALIAWAEKNPKQIDDLPAGVFDILLDFGVLAEESEESDAS